MAAKEGGEEMGEKRGSREGFHPPYPRRQRHGTEHVRGKLTCMPKPLLLPLLVLVL